jgi:hypothetical protein
MEHGSELYAVICYDDIPMCIEFIGLSDDSAESEEIVNTLGDRFDLLTVDEIDQIAQYLEANPSR